jgi:hypothetical protein
MVRSRRIARLTRHSKAKMVPNPLHCGAECSKSLHDAQKWKMHSLGGASQAHW